MLFGIKTRRELKTELKEAHNLIDVLIKKNDVCVKAVHGYHKTTSEYLNKDRGDKKKLRADLTKIHDDFIKGISSK